MNAKRKIAALFLVATIVCTVTAMFVPTGVSEEAGSGVTVVASAPEVVSVSLEPAEIVLTPDAVVEATLIAEVFCPNSVEWVERVELTNVEPTFKELPLPVPLKRISVEDGTRARYQLVMELPCNLPAGEYTLTVTATDKDGNTGTGTGYATVLETPAFSVTDVDFGSLAPGQSSEAESTVTNLGNVRFKFDEPDGIMPSDMRTGKKTIAAENIAVNWDWSTVVNRGYFHPGESVKEAGFTLTVPFGTSPGKYTGRIVFVPTAVAAE